MGVSTVNVRSDSGFSNAQYTLYFVYLGLIVCFSSYAGEFLRFPVSISNIMLSFSLHHFGGDYSHRLEVVTEEKFSQYYFVLL